MTLTPTDLDQIRSIVQEAVTTSHTELMRVIMDLAQHTEIQIAELRAEMNQRFARIEMRLDSLEARMDAVESRLDSIEMRLGTAEQTIRQLEMKVNSLEEKLDVLSRRTDENTVVTMQDVDRLRKRVSRLEHDHKSLRQQLDARRKLSR